MYKNIFLYVTLNYASSRSDYYINIIYIYNEIFIKI